jgi:hypothetical protein
MRLVWKGLSSATVAEYLLFLSGMGALSLVFGFLYSKYVVFRERDQ